MGRMLDDDVVENFGLQELPTRNQVTSDFDVSFRWGRFPARMVVRDDNCGGASATE